MSQPSPSQSDPPSSISTGLSAADRDEKRRILRHSISEFGSELDQRAAKIHLDANEAAEMLSEINTNLFSRVTHVREAMAEASQMIKLVRHVHENARIMNATRDFTLDEIVAKARLAYNQLEPDDQGNQRKRRRASNSSHADNSGSDDDLADSYFDFYSGRVHPAAFHLPYNRLEIRVFIAPPISSRELEDAEAAKLAAGNKKRNVRRGENMDNVAEERPEEMTEESLAALEKTMDQDRLELQKAMLPDAPMEFWRFLVDPDRHEGFQHTIENLFDFSFLVKDGFAAVEEINGMPYVRRTGLNELNGQIIQSKQAIISFDQFHWHKFIKEFNIKRATLVRPEMLSQQQKKKNNSTARSQSQSQIIESSLPSSPSSSSESPSDSQFSSPVTSQRRKKVRQ